MRSFSNCLVFALLSVALTPVGSLGQDLTVVKVHTYLNDVPDSLFTEELERLLVPCSNIQAVFSEPSHAPPIASWQRQTLTAEALEQDKVNAIMVLRGYSPPKPYGQAQADMREMMLYKGDPEPVPTFFVGQSVTGSYAIYTLQYTLKPVLGMSGRILMRPLKEELQDLAAEVCRIKSSTRGESDSLKNKVRISFDIRSDDPRFLKTRDEVMRESAQDFMKTLATLNELKQIVFMAFPPQPHNDVGVTPLQLIDLVSAVKVEPPSTVRVEAVLARSGTKLGSREFALTGDRFDTDTKALFLDWLRSIVDRIGSDGTVR